MLSDEALYERLLGGKLEAFDVLYERYERHLFGFILGQVPDRQEAEDVLHDVFIALLRERRAGASVSSFRAWIFQVARNLCLNRVRARRRAARALEAAAELPRPPLDSADHALEERQRTESLRVAVSRLPPPLAELFQLRSSGLSYEELAEVMGVPLGTVKSRMHEMVSRLREEVQP